MTKNLADELGPHGVTANVIHPGGTRTEKTTPEAEARIAASNTIGRIVDASEIAWLVAILASPLSGAINGDPWRRAAERPRSSATNEDAMSRHAFILGGTARSTAPSPKTSWPTAGRSRSRPGDSGPCPKRCNDPTAKAVTLDREAPGELASALGNGADALIDVMAYGPGTDTS